MSLSNMAIAVGARSTNSLSRCSDARSAVENCALAMARAASAAATAAPRQGQQTDHRDSFDKEMVSFERLVGRGAEQSQLLTLLRTHRADNYACRVH